jgi:potassium efflux system protein
MSCSRRLWTLAVVALALVVLSPAAVSTSLGQKLLGGSSSAKADKSDKAVGSGSLATPERRDELEKALSAAQQAVEAERAGRYPIPAGATPSQVTELGWLLQRFSMLLQTQIDMLAEIETARANRASAEKALATWKGPARPGPYTLTEVDRALDQLDAERTRLHAYQSVATLQNEELLRIEELLKSSQAAERLTLERSSGGAQTPLELARLRTRRLSEALVLIQLQGELNRELMHAAQARVAVYEKQAATLSADYRFSADELERIVKAMQAQQSVLDQRVEEASDARSRMLAERDQVRGVIESEPTPKSVGEVRRRAEQQVQLEAADQTLEALRMQLSALNTLRGLLPISIEAWRQRYAALGDPDADARRMAEKSLMTVLSRVDSLKSYAADLGALSDAALQDQQRRLDVLDENAPGRRYQLAALEATRRADDAVGEVQALAQRMATAQTRWKREYSEAGDRRTAAERFADVRARLKDLVGSIWDFELFAVEDTLDIGGKPTTVSRGITVGKSIGALLIFVVGYWIAGLFAQRAQRVVVRRFEVSEAQARVLRRWIMLLTGFALLVLTLNLARIPLTVFAFMGGALAIGVGFGTQTLLRNLISGVIVLFERKVRVGDIVDVDGVQGVVTAVDIRSTTVRQFDGIETMVPNSLLLEQKVTNWTGESPTMRRVVKVGVAYGSPTRKVADVLEAVAAEHGLVMKDPKPLVIFEDFGDSALIFALYFWVDVMKSSGMQIQSDLRYMLEKRFAEAGITVAFPQRNIHLDSEHPLQIEVVAGAPVSRAA